MNDNLFAVCKPCTRGQRLLYRYGITPERYEEMKTEQDGRCRICGVHEDDLDKPLFIDHDHTHCGGEFGCPVCVRGLLCSGCNWLLGSVNDSVERLEAAAGYLRTASAQVAAKYTAASV